MTDDSYAKVAREVPDIIMRSDIMGIRLSQPCTPEERKLAAEIRTASLAFRSSKAAHGQISTGYSDADESLDEEVEHTENHAADGVSESDGHRISDNSTDTGIDDEDTPNSDDVDGDETDDEDELAPEMTDPGNVDPRLFDSPTMQIVSTDR